MNYLSHLVAFIIAVILLFIVPAFRTFWIVDQAIIKQVEFDTHQFVNTARHKGYISRESYEAFANSLSKTNNVYDIEIIHYKKSYAPGAVLGESVSYDDVYTTKHILDIAYNKKTMYKMRIGDSIVVSVKNKSKTGTAVFWSMMGSDNLQIINSRYGGSITNEDY